MPAAPRPPTPAPAAMYNPLASNLLLVFAVLVLFIIYGGSAAKTIGYSLETAGAWFKSLFLA